jgi:hypothetical protein
MIYIIFGSIFCGKFCKFFFPNNFLIFSIVSNLQNAQGTSVKSWAKDIGISNYIIFINIVGIVYNHNFVNVNKEK